MTSDASKRLGEFFSAFSGGATPYLLLDYDGTLAPFRLDRFRARPWAGVRELLTRIRRQGRTRMVVITGRPAREIAPLLWMEPPLEVWGLHGAERLLPNGRRQMEQMSLAARETLDKLRATLKRDSLGGHFEDKANGVVMHWRGFSPHKAKQIEQKTRALFEPAAGIDGLTLLEFEAGLELRAGCDKGGAVEAILREAGDDSQVARPVAFLGDDLTDEAAFRAVKNLGPLGLGVLMRRQWQQTDADVWLRPPVELRWFLETWLSACAIPVKEQGTLPSPGLADPAERIGTRRAR
ncbi:MAG: trehalose-phosphatase [Terracidiphilus sp.]